MEDTLIAIKLPAWTRSPLKRLMVQETRRILDIAALDHALYFWRTNNGADCSGLRSFHEDNPDVPCWIVCTAPEIFRLDFVEVIPWKDYLRRLPESA